MCVGEREQLIALKGGLVDHHPFQPLTSHLCPIVSPFDCYRYCPSRKILVVLLKRLNIQLRTNEDWIHYTTLV